MAIDTAAKRRAAAGAGCVALLPGVTPAGASSAFQRRAASWGYGGVATVVSITAIGGRSAVSYVEFRPEASVEFRPTTDQEFRAVQEVEL